MERQIIAWEFSWAFLFHLKIIYMTKEEVIKILMDSKIRMPLNEGDIAIYMVDIPAAAEKLMELINKPESK